MNTSNPVITSDMHQQGLFVVLNPDGSPHNHTAHDTAHSACSAYTRDYGPIWSQARKKGMRIGSYALIADVVSKKEQEASSTGFEIGGQMFNPPSGEVIGMTHMTIPGKKKGTTHTLIAGHYLTDGTLDTTLKMPSQRMDLDTLETVARAMLVFVAQSRDTLASLAAKKS